MRVQNACTYYYSKFVPNRIRVEHMERQLANLTGLVQKALTHAPHSSPSPRDYLQVPAGRDPYARTAGTYTTYLLGALYIDIDDILL